MRYLRPRPGHRSVSHKLKRSALWLGAAGATSGLIYTQVARPWFLQWGATAEEGRRILPGDDLAPRPQSQATRAITIRALPESVWPWLVQLGQGRGGFYSYELIENLFGCDIHNTSHILPEHQNLAVGDPIRLGPDGYPLYRVHEIRPGRWLVLLGADPTTGATPDLEHLPPTYTIGTWVFFLEPLDGNETRLIVRSRVQHSPDLAQAVIWKLVEPVHFVMEQRMLTGIKERAERHNGPRYIDL